MVLFLIQEVSTHKKNYICQILPLRNLFNYFWKFLERNPFFPHFQSSTRLPRRFSTHTHAHIYKIICQCDKQMNGSIVLSRFRESCSGVVCFRFERRRPHRGLRSLRGPDNEVSTGETANQPSYAMVEVNKWDDGTERNKCHLFSYLVVKSGREINAVCREEASSYLPLILEKSANKTFINAQRNDFRGLKGNLLFFSFL